MPSALYPLADAFVLPGGYGAHIPDGATRGQRVAGELLADAGTLSNLTVRGQLNLLRSGALKAGQDAFDTGTGFFMDYNDGTPRFSLGNSNGNKMLWDGSALSITGAMNVDSGTIGGWDVGASNLVGGTAELNSAGFMSLGSGNNIFRADAANSQYRMWVGNSNPALAPFSVTPAGQLNASNINVTGGMVAGGTVGAGINGGNISAGTINGNAIQANSIAADRLSVSNLSAISANLGTITAGTINGGTINVQTLKAGTLTLGADGSLNGTAGLAGTLGNVSLGNLTVTGVITLGPGGRIQDADGSFWDQSGITLNSTSNLFGDGLLFKLLGVTKGYIGGRNIGLVIEGPTGYFISVENDVVAAGVPAGAQWQARHEELWAKIGEGPSSYLRIMQSFTEVGQWDGVGDIRARRIYPGNVTGTLQSNTYIASPGDNLNVHLRDSAGTYQFRVYNSSGGQVWGVSSTGKMGLAGTITAALGAYKGKVLVSWNGQDGYIPIYG